MWKSIRATTREELDVLEGELHDACRVDMESARHDPAARTLTFDFEYADFSERKVTWNLLLAARWKIPVRRGTLVFRGVVAHEVRDGARIGGQGVNRVTGDDAGRRLRVEMCEDGDILVDADSIDVQVDVTEAVVRWSVMYMFLLVESGEF